MFALDPIPELNPKVKELIQFKYIQDTTDAVKDMIFDFVLMDGFHSLEWNWKDYENVKKLAEPIIGIRDPKVFALG